MSDYNNASLREIDQDIELAKKRIKDNEEFIVYLTKIKSARLQEGGAATTQGAAM